MADKTPNQAATDYHTIAPPYRASPHTLGGLELHLSGLEPQPCRLRPIWTANKTADEEVSLPRFSDHARTGVESALVEAPTWV